jgi:hypothetical protein
MAAFFLSRLQRYGSSFPDGLYITFTNATGPDLHQIVPVSQLARAYGGCGARRNLLFSTQTITHSAIT